ncbi:hypothetical protein HPULCUR_003734 [Helicostylum pulchrum]|uniref:Uncharacterized protein n=1 Tax=Helicostylum pulchrum TaxID=562976 RepID=A0ABP9XU97_9FUNG
MSEDSTYKESFIAQKITTVNTFATILHPEWTCKKFKEHFKQASNPEALYKKQLRVVKEPSKAIPPSVLEKIGDQLKDVDDTKNTNSINTSRYYNVGTVQGNLIINESQQANKKRIVTSTIS